MNSICSTSHFIYCKSKTSLRQRLSESQRQCYRGTIQLNKYYSNDMLALGADLTTWILCVTAYCRNVGPRGGPWPSLSLIFPFNTLRSMVSQGWVEVLWDCGLRMPYGGFHVWVSMLVDLPPHLLQHGFSQWLFELGSFVPRSSLYEFSYGLKVYIRPAVHVTPEVQLREDNLSQSFNHQTLCMVSLEFVHNVLLQGYKAYLFIRIKCSHIPWCWCVLPNGRGVASIALHLVLWPLLFLSCLAPVSLLLGLLQLLILSRLGTQLWQKSVESFVGQIRKVTH